MIDLHTHSAFSDGELSPEELAERAGAAGLEAIALTDHDTTDGVPRFLDACRKHGVNGVSGVEISAEYSPGTMHMLGYFVDVSEQRLQSALSRIRGGRRERNTQILQRLDEMNLDVTWGEVLRVAGDEAVVGRPHIARVLMDKGYVRTKQAAFDRYLGKGKPAYVNRLRYEPRECIDLIRGAGGVAVLAHPVSLRLSRHALTRVVEELADAGLSGLEVVYPEHSPKQTTFFRQLAEKSGLVVTGGSDFHGPGMSPDIRLGVGFGGLRIPRSCVEELRSCIELERRDGILVTHGGRE